MEELSAYYVQDLSTPANVLRTLLNFGLIPANNDTSQQYSPLIYDNYLTFQSYGQVATLAPNQTLNTSDFENVFYIPIFLDTDPRTKIYISQQTANQMLENYQKVNMKVP